jgi:peroxiredoxin (alkyl hydroperoxide reductase subunit C)
VARDENSLINQLGYFYEPAGAALRVTLIVDPSNEIQHVTVNNLNVGRNPEETLRILDALQTGELCACNRSVGGETL